ncbi:metallophosphoesterase [Mesobacillus foraminis]|uniref:metallophosphoesterase n=1 Tax=Mesobacillus foraminis TaxID=279826 RepID=UPI000EF45A17|nr:metallophosphoesterase [Mesobacillus foraminis]
MQNKVTRRSFIKRALGSFLTVAGIGAGGYFYAHDIEPKLLDVTRHEIKNRRLPAGFDGLRIVQFSDTHIGFHYNLDTFDKLMDEINSLAPDIILFTGDLMDNPNEFNEHERIVQTLKRLEAEFGKYAIYGNHDHGGYGSDIYKKIMEEAGFTLLMNESDSVTLLDGSSIYIAGVDDAMLGRPNLEAAIQGIPKDSYTILLAHEPDQMADLAAKNNIHLQLSGHSHGGQIQVPFYGPLVTPPLAEVYTEGFYQVGDGEGMPLYVNRGLGTTRLPFRFLSRPELSVFTLKSE